MKFIKHSQVLDLRIETKRLVKRQRGDYVDCKYLSHIQ